MQLQVEHRLNVRFVDVDSSAEESFRHEAVLIRLGTHKDHEGAFASVACSGVIDVTLPGADAPPDAERKLTTRGRFSQRFPFLLPPEIDPGWDLVLAKAYERVEVVLEELGTLLRWRFKLSGHDSIFAETSVVVRPDAQHAVELQHISQAAMGDDRASIEPGGLSEVASMLASNTHEPVAHQLWREAWNLRFTNPRSSLVIGVAAAEVGLKQTIATLVPLARWLVEELPSTPLVPMMKNYLPDLPIRADVERNRRCPKHLRSTLDAAVRARNAVVHRGAGANVDLRTTLLVVREFLYLLDFYGGNAWALRRLSTRTIEALGLESPPAR
jgi:hypothetical protein